MELEKIDAGKLRSLLTEGKVEFAFKKVGGTLRTATGTTKLSSIPSDNHPIGMRPSPESVITFFDIQKQEWRRVSVESEMFVKIE